MKRLTILLMLAVILGGCVVEPYGSGRDEGYSHREGDRDDHRHGEEHHGDRGGGY